MSAGDPVFESIFVLGVEVIFKYMLNKFYKAHLDVDGTAAGQHDRCGRSGLKGFRKKTNPALTGFYIRACTGSAQCLQKFCAGPLLPRICTGSAQGLYRVCLHRICSTGSVQGLSRICTAVECLGRGPD